MPPKQSSGAVYAAAKREAENTARNALEAVIDAGSSTPDQYFKDDIAKNNTRYNPTTKVLSAATAYITDLEAARDTAQAQLAQARSQAPRQPTNNSHAPITSAIAPPSVYNDLDIANLRQATRRCMAKAEEKMQALQQAGASASAELKEVLRTGHDLLVDLTTMIEQGGMTREQKRKWAQEQESWGRKYNLQ